MNASANNICRAQGSQRRLRDPFSFVDDFNIDIIDQENMDKTMKKYPKKLLQQKAGRPRGGIRRGSVLKRGGIGGVSVTLCNVNKRPTKMLSVCQFGILVIMFEPCIVSIARIFLKKACPDKVATLSSTSCCV